MNLWNKIDTDSRNNSSQKSFQISNTLSSLFTYCILNYRNVLFKYLSRKKTYMFCRICIPGESGAWSCRQVQREERQEQGFRHRKPKSQADFSPSSLKSISRTFMTILTILWVCIHTDFLKAFAWNLVTNRQKYILYEIWPCYTNREGPYTNPSELLWTLLKPIHYPHKTILQPLLDWIGCFMLQKVLRKIIHDSRYFCTGEYCTLLFLEQLWAYTWIIRD